MLLIKRPLNKDKLPPLYPPVERVEESKKNNFQGYDKVGDFVLRPKIDLIPNRKVQEPLIASDADIRIAMGSIAMGKTYCLGLLCLDRIHLDGYTGYIYSKRLIDSKEGGSLFRDFKQIIGSFADCKTTIGDYPTFMFPTWRSSVQLRHANFNTETKSGWKEFEEHVKKSQGSDIMVDEATDWDFKSLMYLLTRGRDDSGCTTRLTITGNPEHEHWTTSFLLQGGYLNEKWYLKKEMLEKTRYVLLKENPRECIFGESRSEVVEKAGGLNLTQEELDDGYVPEDFVKSVAVFSGSILANKKGAANMKGSNIGNTYNVGDDGRKRLKEGYFGPQDKSEITVATNVINGLWTNEGTQTGVYFASLDVSAGRDITNMFIWDGLDIIACEQMMSDNPIEITSWVQAMLNKYKITESNFVYDADGLGFFLRQFTLAYGVKGKLSPLPEYDEAGNRVDNEGYATLRSQLLGKTEALLKMGRVSCSLDRNLMLPHGKKKKPTPLIDILNEEKDVFKHETKNNRIYYKNKDEFKTRYGYSPDYMDSLMYRMYFELDLRQRRETTPELSEDDYYDFYFS